MNTSWWKGCEEDWDGVVDGVCWGGGGGGGGGVGGGGGGGDLVQCVPRCSEPRGRAIDIAVLSRRGHSTRVEVNSSCAHSRQATFIPLTLIYLYAH